MVRNAICTMRLFGLSFLCLLLRASPAAADNSEEARKAFSRGIALVESEAYEEALSAFEASYRINPKPSVLLNIGMCHQALSQNVEALLVFKQYLEEAGEEGSTEKKRAASDSIDKLSQLVGYLVVDKAPEGAVVSIDGQGWGQAPLKEPIIVNPGSYTVEVTLEGYLPFKVEATAASGRETRISAELKPEEPRLIVRCKEEGGVVAIDDEEVGRCPFESRIALGTHTVRVTAEGRQPFAKTVNAEPGKDLEIEVELDVLSDETPAVSPSSAVDEKSPNGSPALLIAGVSSIAAGVVAGTIGLIYTANGARAFDNAKSLANRNDGSWSEERRAEYADILDRAQKGMVAGYAMAGVFLPVGVAILLIDAKRKKRGNEHIAVSPRALGVKFDF